MNAKSNESAKKIDWFLILVSALVLPICLAYAFAAVYLIPYSGVDLNSEWQVISIAPCPEGSAWCEANQKAIRPGDQMLAIGDLTYQVFAEDRTLVPFDGYKPGETISIRLSRNGEKQTILWHMPPVTSQDRALRLIGAMIYLPFWLAGTAVLFFLRPRDERWRTLIFFFYLTAIWLAAGSVSTSQVMFSSLVMSSTTWIIIPIYIHLHLLVPSQLMKKLPRRLLFSLYFSAGIFAILEIFQLLPTAVYGFGLLLAIGGSLGVLVYRLIKKSTSSSDKLAARWLLSGMAFAFGPGIMLWIVPSTIGVDLPALWQSIVTALAVPAMPMFYIYVVYKHQMGGLEFRANSFLGIYSFILLYITVFVSIFSIASRLIVGPSALMLLNLAISVVFVAAGPLLYAYWKRAFDRLAYGARHNPEEIIQFFASQVPTVGDRQALINLLADEVAPSLLIRQSALYLFNDVKASLIYQREVDTQDDSTQLEPIQNLMEQAGHYLPPQSDSEDQYAWVRLVIPLKMRDKSLGVWLFGRRDPDDYYPRADIDLLSTLANQVTLALENSRLFADSRRQTEELTALYNAARSVGSIVDRDALLDQLYEQVQSLIPLDACLVGLSDEALETYEIIFAKEAGKTVREAVGLRLPVVEGALSGWVIHTGKSLLIGDLETDPLPIQTRYIGRRVHSWLGVPLIAYDRVAGAISIQSIKSNAFNESDLRFMQSIAGHLAIALENARLFEETRQRAAQQEALNAIIWAAALIIDLPKLLDVALDHTLDALDLDMGAAWLTRPSIFRGRGCPPRHGRVSIATALSDLAASGMNAVEDWTKVLGDDGQPIQEQLLPSLGFSSSLIVPLLSDEQRIGGLALFASTPRHWSGGEIALTKSIGQQLGGAVERVRLLNQIQQQARQMERVLDAVQEGIMTLDTDMRIILTNPTARDCLAVLADVGEGQVLTHLGDQPISELLSPRKDQLPYVITIEGHKPQTFEVIATPIQISETKSGWTILIREVTEVRRVQELAQEQDRLAAVGQLAAGIAHDFNNIIAAITLFSEMLMDETGLSPKGKERITVIQQQSQRAANLTRQILDFSRKTVMDLRSMDLVPFLKEFDKLMTRILPESIHLKLKYSDKSYMVRADPSRIEQVFMNLALNARDAISGNGELCYEIEHVQFGPDEQPPFAGMTHDRWIRLRVSDTGSGIPPDVLPHIFNPFFTTKSPGQGTGLGLAQVYGIVKQHDGYIEVTSQVEEGTTFTIYFPALEAQSLTKPLQEATQLAHGNRETILVVEDEQATRQAICEILESLNYQPMSASNGQEALALLKKETGTIDMLLSDMVMPEIGGMELFQLIQDMQLDIPLLLMTAYPLGKDTQMLLDRKQVTWIQKPIDLETLSNAIWEKLHKKS